MITVRLIRRYSVSVKESVKTLSVLNQNFRPDDFTNVTPKILSLVNRNLHNDESHPLGLLKRRIVEYFYSKYKGRTGTPLFSVYDRLSPVVTVEQNFDSLLIPGDHPSRAKSDCYYINRNHLLRAHTTAHQQELMRSGLDNFLVVGDVYRRDEIDSTHYPVFHQVDGVRLFTPSELEGITKSEDVQVFEADGEENSEKQKEHTRDVSLIVGQDLKNTLSGLARALFGKDVKYRWVDVYFPFTHPSWELEVDINGSWVEVLGCGITRHAILQNSGAGDRIGWAFGLGLERLAMRLYSIPDIRLFWSSDSGFLNQFKGKSYSDQITFKPVSVYPQLSNDISFWLPLDSNFHLNDFYELTRSVDDSIVEQVALIDDFTHPKTKRRSLCFRITYRSMERTLTQKEVSEIHRKLADACVDRFKVEIR